MGHHKHKSSTLPDALDLEVGKSEASELPLISPNRLSRELGNRKNSSNGVASSSGRWGTALPLYSWLASPQIQRFILHLMALSRRPGYFKFFCTSVCATEYKRC